MKDEQIYQLMSRKPDILALQICDALNADLKDVSASLRLLVDVGDVVRHSWPGPNGATAQMYNLSDAFKKSRAGVALMAAAAEIAAALASVAPLDPVAPVETPVFANATALPHQGSKVDRAVSFVLQHKLASDDDLRTVMDIVKPAHPKAYLVAAIKSGKLHRGPNGWAPGRDLSLPPAPIPFKVSTHRKGEPVAQFSRTAQPGDVENVATVGNLVLATRDATAIAPEVVAAVAAVEHKSEACKHGTSFRYECEECEEAALLPKTKFSAEDDTNPFDYPAPAAPPVEPVFRCGLWSDGVLELQRNGVTIASLKRKEAEHMDAFMDRVIQWPGKAA